MMLRFSFFPALLMLAEAAAHDSYFHGPRERNNLDNDFFGYGPPLFPFHGGPRGPQVMNAPPRPLGGDRPQWQKQIPDLFSPNDDPDDFFVFDRPTSSRPRPVQTTTTTSGTTTSGQATTISNCDCPSTPEFNPVCGSDSTTYSNPGKLQCAITCGANVSLKHYGSCMPTSTSAPRTTTTRRT